MSEAGPKKSQFVGTTFVAKRRSGDICGSNGLPLMPNSIKILGRAQFLKSLQHPNLCAYLDIVRCKHERTIVVCEHVGEPLTTIKETLQLPAILRIARDVLNGLMYLHNNNITHRALSKENLLLINKKIKLFNYGLYYMSGNGKDVLFPIGNPKYTAPEVFLSGVKGDTGHKADIWSLGVILAELLLQTTLFPQDQSIATIIKYILTCTKEEVINIFQRLAIDRNRNEIYDSLPSDVVEFINEMLWISPIKRSNAKQLLDHRVFFPGPEKMPSNWLSPLSQTLNQLALNQLYHIWLLAGGDVFSELKREGLIRTKAPILLMPNVLLLEGTSYGEDKDHASMLDLRVVRLFLGNLIKHFGALPESARYPLIECVSNIVKNDEHCESSTLPLIIREKYTEYQFRRLTLFNRILESYPYKKELVLKEARQDIPPLVRAQVWACLLEIDLNYTEKYIEIDKETAITTDRQIEVDIPRCHQYNELLSSRVGHAKFKRILKAWVISHPQYVYWQGLDSLCAPFLYLNFNDEARAYACLSNFIKKYLHNFFLKDNSAVIREYLAKFKQLIAFHDPELANHLHHIAFAPELFAIPWYLTMFSHVFPIHKILHLWDSLLIGDASYPLYVGLSILQQLRETLLSSGFNECILLFSDLPEIDIEKCVKESNYFCSTPSSITYRVHELRNSVTEGNNLELEMSGQSLTELQNEFSPRICGREFLEIYNNSTYRSKMTIVDIREANLYESSSIQGSINIPLSKVDLNAQILDGTIITPGPELSLLSGSKGKLTVVVGEDMTETSKFCYLLAARCGFPKVCSLHGGINILRGKLL